jgi:hypothetical protein
MIAPILASQGMLSMSEIGSIAKNLGKVKKEYTLLDPGDIDQNIKEIGDKIVDNLKIKYLENKLDTPEKIEAQIKTDLLSIYYDNWGSKLVRLDMKEQICDAWYAALKTRTTKIMMDVVTLLKNEDKIREVVQSGGMSALKDATPTTGALNGVPANTGAEEQPEAKEANKKREETEKKNKLYFKKLIEYKTEMFAVDNFKKRPISRSATVSQVYSLHEGFVSKILCNYAVIKRANLEEEMRKIIIGSDAIAVLEEYKLSKKWIRPPKSVLNANKTTNDYSKNSIYNSFLKKLQDLSDTTKHNKKSENSILRKSESDEQKGGTGPVDTTIPKHIPSTYIWEKIRGYVETQIQMGIHNHVNMNQKNTNAIKSGFEKVFLQANCDSLDVSPNNKKIMECLTTEYHNMLDYLCINIPDRYAAAILQSYLLRNFDEVTAYFNTLFAEPGEFGVFDSLFLGNASLPPKMLSNKNITPIYPQIRTQEVAKDTNALDKCCDARESEKGLDSTGISDFMKTENIGKERSIADRVTPSILTPVFDVYKAEFTKSTNNPDFLKVLFDMYSGRTVKFLKQIKLQFDNDYANDYIERFILTKHQYTTNIITECIKHAADVRLTLSGLKKGKTSPENEPATDSFDIVSKYAAFLMHSAANMTPPNINDVDETPFIRFIEDQLTSFFTGQPLLMSLNPVNAGVSDIATQITDNIIGKIPSQELDAYDKSLKTLFSTNKTVVAMMRKFAVKSVIPKFRGYTRKRRPDSIETALKIVEEPLGAIGNAIDNGLQMVTGGEKYNDDFGVSVDEFSKPYSWQRVGDLFGNKIKQMWEKHPLGIVQYTNCPYLNSIIEKIKNDENALIHSPLNDTNKFTVSANGEIYNLKTEYYNKYFALEYFKYIPIRGNGNCLFNSISWWIINYYTVNNDIFGKDIRKLLDANKYAKSPYITNPADNSAENVLKLIGSEILYNASGALDYCVDSKTKIDLFSIEVSKGKKYGDSIKLLHCTKLAVYLRELICGVYKRLTDLNDYGGTADNWLKTLISFVSKDVLPYVQGVENYVNNHICKDGKDGHLNEVMLLGYIFQVNIVVIMSNILNSTGDKFYPQPITEQATFRINDDRPTMYILYQSGHWSVLYPCDVFFEKSITPLLVADRTKHYEYNADVIAKSIAAVNPTTNIPTTDIPPTASHNKGKLLKEFDNLYNNAKFDSEVYAQINKNQHNYYKRISNTDKYILNIFYEINAGLDRNNVNAIFDAISTIRSYQK